MAVFKVISLEEQNRYLNRVSLSLKMTNDKFPEAIYYISASSVFEDGKFRELVISEVNGKGAKGSYGKWTSVAMDLNVAMTKYFSKIEEEIEEKIKVVLHGFQNICTIENAAIAYHPNLTVAEFLNFYEKMSVILDEGVSVDETREGHLQKCSIAILTTHKKHKVILNLRDFVSKTKKTVDEKMTEMVLNNYESKSFKIINKLKLSDLIKGDLSGALMSSIGNQVLNKNKTFIPISFLLKKDPKYVMDLIIKSIKELKEDLDGDIKCDVDSKKGVDKVYIHNISNPEYRKRFGQDYTNEISGLNFKIGEGTFRVSDLVPSKYSAFIEVEDRIIIRCLTSNITSKKAELVDCYTDFDLEVNHLILRDPENVKVKTQDIDVFTKKVGMKG